MRVIEYTPDNALENRIKIGFAVSILIHVFLFSFLTYSTKHSPPREQFIEVSIVPPADNQIKNSQMVTPMESAPETDQNVNTRYESDKNTLVEKEQIKRGSEMSAPVVGKNLNAPASPAAENKPAPPEPQKEKKAADTPKSQTGTKSPPSRLPDSAPVESEKGTKPLSTLRLDSQTLMDKFASPSNRTGEQTDRAANPSENYRAFSRPEGSGAAFIGNTGSSDFLPNLPDGDITLLNTKANQYAVFVRRVATLVFSHMRSTGWETLQASDLNRIQDFCTIRAVLDVNGNLEKISIEGPSGSSRFDQTLAMAVKTGAHDPNPPKGALAEDGKFHFIFKSKSWSQMASNRRTGAGYERRWLLLATGLL